MPVPFVTGGRKENAGKDITSLTIDYATDDHGNDPNARAANALDFVWIAKVVISDAVAAGITLATPSGWTQIRNADGTTFNKQYVYYKVYDGSIGSVTFEASAECAKIQGWMILVGSASVASPAPVTQSGGQATGPTQSHSTPAITPDFANSLIVAAFTSPDTPAKFRTPTGMTEIFSSQASGSAGTFGMEDAYAAQPAIASVSKTATSINGTTGANYTVSGIASIISINPSQLPSPPDLISPNGGESYVVGITVLISWIAALSEVVASSLLKYHIQYSPDNGNTWADVVALTSAGVTTYSWSTTGRAVGSQYRIRIRATSDSGSTFGPYETSAATFSLITETTPGKPTGVHMEQPAGTSVAVIDRATAARVAWTHAGGTVNPQTTWTGRWSVNADMSSPTAFNPGTGTNQFHDFGTLVFAHGATIYIQVRTTGLTLQSDWSDPVSFVASTLPVVSLISPTAGSPPTVSFPTITVSVTTGDMSQRRYRFTQGGNQVYDSGWVSTSQLVFVSDYSLATGVAYVLLVSIKNQYGLASAEDSETLTPSFTAPDEPTIVATALTEDGCIQLDLAHTDTPDETQIFRDDVLIAEGIGVNGVYRDFTVEHGREYSYVARAVNATGFTDSDPDTATLTLESFWLTVLTKTLSTSNALLAVEFYNQGPSQYGKEIEVEYASMRGLRLLPLPLMTPRSQQRLSCAAEWPGGDQTTLAAVEEAYNSNLDVCARDTFGNLVIGKLQGLSVQRSQGEVKTISFTVAESNYDEEIA